jgi:hypothetical protein
MLSNSPPVGNSLAGYADARVRLRPASTWLVNPPLRENLPSKLGKNKTMQLGVLVPFHATDGDPDTVRDYAQCLKATAYDFLEAPDHVLGANFATPSDWAPDRNTPQNRHHDPFVLLGYVSSIATGLSFLKSTRAARKASAAFVRR